VDIASSLLAATWVNTLLTSVFDPHGTSFTLVSLVGQSVAIGLALPLVYVYLKRVASTLPASLATAPRPILDILTSTQQLEARARDQQNLLRILSQADQLIVRSTHTGQLLANCWLAGAPIRWYGSNK
jgi:hypothetical protein